MSNSNDTTIQTINWRQLFPWTLIFRSFVPAVSATVIGLATVGVIVNALGWRVSETLFVRDTLRERSPDVAMFAEQMRSPWIGIYQSYQPGLTADRSIVQLTGPSAVFQRMIEPYFRLFEPAGGMMKFFYLLLGILITIAVWALIGTAITRIALYRYTRSESLPIREAFQFALKETPSSAFCVLTPLIAIAALAIPGALIGLLMTFNLGLLIGSLLYVVVVLLAILMTLLALGLAFGWPLSISAVSAEGQGFFDGLTRSFAYTFQRPFSYAFYALVAVIVGGLAWIVINWAAVSVERLADWSISWGANVSSADRLQTIQMQADGSLDAAALANTAGEAGTLPWSFRAGANVLYFWQGLIRTLAVGFLFGHFWCLAAAIYLLLRKQVDDAELDELFVRDEQRTYELPELDANGNPGGSTAATGHSSDASPSQPSATPSLSPESDRTGSERPDLERTAALDETTAPPSRSQPESTSDGPRIDRDQEE